MPSGRAARIVVNVSQRYGALVVTEIDLRAPLTPSQRESGQLGARAAACKCDCGGELLVTLYALVDGKATDCGCRMQSLLSGVGSTPDRTSCQGAGGGRKPQPIPAAELYQPVIDDFLRAALLDSSYAEAICHSATRVLNRRLSWQVRLDLRAAEAAARTACASSNLASCEVQSPCGTGECAWSAPQFAHIEAPAIADHLRTARRATRPQPRTGPGHEYTIESALPLVMAERSTF